MCHSIVINSLYEPDEVSHLFSTDLLVILLFRLEAVVNGLKPQVDMRKIVKPVSPPGRNVIHPSRRHPCPEKKVRLQPKLALFFFFTRNGAVWSAAGDL